MTAPRQVLPGTTYLVTRRCAQRQFLLRPSGETNSIFLFVLALAARRFNVRIHAACVLSNHFHLLLTDVDGCLPAFQQYLASLVARAVNASLGRWEAFWAPASYSAVSLTTPDDVVSKAAYVLANPVAAGLVARATEWPGIWLSAAHRDEGMVHAARPATFFRRNGYLPASVELELTPPPGMTCDEFRGRVRSEVAALEGQARRTAHERGRAVLGVDRVLAQRPTSRPATLEPRRGLAPRVAARDIWKRIEALSRVREFVRAYREARDALRRGVRDVCFPEGTYLLRVTLGVRCASSA